MKIPISPGNSRTNICPARSHAGEMKSNRYENAKPMKIKIGGRINRKCLKPSYIEGLRISTYASRTMNQVMDFLRRVMSDQFPVACHDCYAKENPDWLSEGGHQHKWEISPW